MSALPAEVAASPAAVHQPGDNPATIPRSFEALAAAAASGIAKRTKATEAASGAGISVPPVDRASGDSSEDPPMEDGSAAYPGDNRAVLPPPSQAAAAAGKKSKSGSVEIAPVPVAKRERSVAAAPASSSSGGKPAARGAGARNRELNPNERQELDRLRREAAGLRDQQAADLAQTDLYGDAPAVKGRASASAAPAVAFSEAYPSPRLAEFEVVKHLSASLRTGQGDCWILKSKTDGRDVFFKACKNWSTLGPEKQAHDMVRVQREAQALITLQQQNVTGVLRLDPIVHGNDGSLTTDDGCPFLVTNLLQGCTVEDWIKANHGQGYSFPTMTKDHMADIIEFFDQLLLIIKQCHSCGILHRDIKIDNIFLVDSSLRVPVLLDFGQVFTAVDTTVTLTTEKVGNTALFFPEIHGMSEEGLKEEGKAAEFKLNKRHMSIDTAQSAAVFLHLAFGNSSAQIHSIPELATVVQHSSSKWFQRFPGLYSVLCKALMYHPEKRYLSGADMLSAFQQTRQAVNVAAMAADFSKLLTPIKQAGAGGDGSDFDETKCREVFNAKLKPAITKVMAQMAFDEENKHWRRIADGKPGFFMEYSSTQGQYWKLQVVMHIHANGKLVNATLILSLLTASASAPVTRSESEPLALNIFTNEGIHELARVIHDAACRSGTFE